MFSMAEKLTRRLFPFLSWFPLSTMILRGDLVAGITGGLVLVPKAMAYAQLSGLPLQFGLYTAFVPAILGALWGSSRQLATGPVAIISLMTAAAITPLALPGSEEYIGLALLLTLLVGLIQLLLGVVKLGTVVNFVSHPVILGFMNAAAIIIGLSQLDLLLGLPKGRSDFFLQDIWEMLGYLRQTHLPTLAMSALGLLLLLTAKRIPFLAKPGVLVVVLLTTLLSALLGYEHNSAAQIEEIASPRAKGLIRRYQETAQELEQLAVTTTRLAAELRQAEMAGDSRSAADLRYRLELRRVDSTTLSEENGRRLRTVYQLFLVHGRAEAGAPLRLYQLDRVPPAVVQEGRPWRIKKIEGETIKLVGGGEVVGKIPAGLPSFRLPTLGVDAVRQLLTAALVIALVAFMESISMAKAMAGKARQHIDPNQELIGQGVANIGGSLFQAYPACGSFTGSAINLQAGARTGLAMVTNGLFVALTLLFLTPTIYHLPKAVLAVIILLAVAGLITPRAFQHIWKASRSDGVVALTTFVVTLLAAPHLDQGILAGTTLAIGLSLYRSMAPRVAIFGGTDDGTLHHLREFPQNGAAIRVVAIRFDGSLYFANVAHFEEAVLAALAGHRQARYLLVLGGGINNLDSSGEEMLHNLVVQLHESGVEMFFAGLKRQVVDVLQATGLLGFIGAEKIFASEAQALRAISQRLEGEEDAGHPLLPDDGKERRQN